MAPSLLRATEPSTQVISNLGNALMNVAERLTSEIKDMRLGQSDLDSDVKRQGFCGYQRGKPADHYKTADAKRRFFGRKSLKT